MADWLDRRIDANRPMRRTGPRSKKIASRGIRTDFFNAKRSHPDLGKETSEILCCNLYVGVHENATVLWVDELSEFIVSSTGGNPRTVLQYLDHSWDDRKLLQSDSEMAALLNTPPDKLPPYSGVAKMWLLKPEEWSRIGWRRWHRNFPNNTGFCQRFEKGFVVGVVPLSPDNVAGNLWIIMTDGSLFLMPVSTSASKGVEPHTV